MQLPIASDRCTARHRTPRITRITRIHPGTPTPNHGFTLIELLVVISVIALLISILLPALSAARDVARQSACLSNIRQVGLMHFMYANDFDGYLQTPESYAALGSSPVPTRWFVTRPPAVVNAATLSFAGNTYKNGLRPLYPYGLLHDEPAAMCPSIDFGAPLTPVMTEALIDFKGRFAYTYRLSTTGYYGTGNANNDGQQLRLNQVFSDQWLRFDGRVDPSPHFGEGDEIVVGTRNASFLATNLVVNSPGNPNVRHGGLSTVYFDGSARSVPSGEYLDRTEHANP